MQRAGRLQHQREQRRHQDQGQPGKQPVCQHLGQHQKSQGCGERTHCSREPSSKSLRNSPSSESSTANSAATQTRPGDKVCSNWLSGPTAREQGDDDGEEHQRVGQLRRSAEQQARLARQKQAEDVAHAGSPNAGSTVAPLAALSAPEVQLAVAGGHLLQAVVGGQHHHPAALAMPGQVRFQLRHPCLSRAVKGSSRIHKGGASRYRRASATRRCWPAEGCGRERPRSHAGRRRPGPARSPRGWPAGAARRAR